MQIDKVKGIDSSNELLVNHAPRRKEILSVPYTSTIALTNVTLSYIINIANNGWEKACENDLSLSKGLNIVNGKVVYKEIEEAF